MNKNQNSFRVFVERKLHIKAADTGAMSEIEVQIGYPQVVDESGDADCPVAIIGLFDTLPPIRGIDSLSAVTLAIEFVDRLLVDLEKEGRLYWPDGEKYCSTSEL